MIRTFSSFTQFIVRLTHSCTKINRQKIAPEARNIGQILFESLHKLGHIYAVTGFVVTIICLASLKVRMGSWLVINIRFGENRFGGSDIVNYCYERSQAWRLIKNVIRDEIRLLHFLKLLKS